jgi:DNA-binding beta-propeller fold protein YncE
MIEARTIAGDAIRRSVQRTAIAAVTLGLIPAGDARGQAVEATGTLVVVNKRASTATIVDVRSGTTLATLPTGNGPHEVAISKDGGRAVVTDYGGQTAGSSLTVIDVPGLRVEKRIELERYSRPHGIAFLPGDSLVAVTPEDARSVIVVRLADGAIVRAVPTEAGGSHMLALVASGERAYTGNISDETVSELSLTDGEHTGTFAAPTQPEAIGVMPDGSEVWVGSNDQGTVSVIDVATGNLEEVLDGFGWPYRILPTPDSRLVLIPDLRGNELRIVDQASRQALATIALPDAGPQGITLSGDGKLAFQSLSQLGQVAIIDMVGMKVVGYVEVGDRPDGVAYTAEVVGPR